MKITNSSIYTNPLESYRSKNNAENADEAPNKIHNQNNQPENPTDTLTLSDRAKRLIEDEEAVKDISRQLETVANSEGSPYDELTKCLEIASRIVKGDKVPQADLNFLMEKQPELFSSAILMKQNSENPKRHKSLLDEPKDNSLKVDDSGKTELDAALADKIPSAEE